MTYRLLGIAMVGAALLTSVGCAASHDEDAAPSSEDDISSKTLKSTTLQKGSVMAGGEAQIDYEASYQLPSGAIPYLAIELKTEAAPDSAGGLKPADDAPSLPQSISVSGPFPGTPKAVVVDESFRVLAHATGTPAANGHDAVVTVSAPRTGGQRFLLVRDGLWTRPMSFDVRAGL